MTEFNLSEKISWESLPPRNEEIIDHGVISTINVKEFIRLLKDYLNLPIEVEENIDKLAGDKLI